MLPARYDDDDDIYICVCVSVCVCVCIEMIDCGKFDNMTEIRERLDKSNT